MFETWFKDISAAKENYQNATTEEERDNARLVYQTISDQIKATDKITQRAFNDYEASRACDNPLLDIREVLWTKDVPAYVESLRSHGAQMFTTSYVGDTDEHEKVPAVLFSLY